MTTDTILTEAPTVDELAGARREHEVFDKVLHFTDWQRCQHGKQIVTVLAHWSDDAPFTVTTGRRNSTQRFERTVHADGGPSPKLGEASWEYGTVRRCPDCGGFNTLSTEQLAWYDKTTCSRSGCDYEHWYAIGD